MKNNRLWLLAATTFYALLLSTKRGAELTSRHTWVLVVIGCGMVLGFLAQEDRQATGNALALFAMAGLPMVARSLLRRAL